GHFQLKREERNSTTAPPQSGSQGAAKPVPLPSGQLSQQFYQGLGGMAGVAAADVKHQVCHLPVQGIPGELEVFNDPAAVRHLEQGPLLVLQGSLVKLFHGGIEIDHHAGDLEHLAVFLPQDHARSEEHTSELQSRENLVCRLLLEKKKTC